jgi:ATP-dependent DNA helicase MPH1
MDQVQKVGLLRGAECIRMHPYRPQGEMNIVRTRADARSLGWVYGVLKKLGSMARAMGYLMESSMNMAYLCLREMAEASEDEGKKAPKISKDPHYIATMSEINKQRMEGFALHPKMVELKSLIIQHFAKQLPEPGTEGEQAGQAEGRVMVFASFRGVVDEIVEVLNQEKPLIRAMKLIGQAADKQGGAGLNQKGQQQASCIVFGGSN